MSANKESHGMLRFSTGSKDKAPTAKRSAEFSQELCENPLVLSTDRERKKISNISTNRKKVSFSEIVEEHEIVQDQFFSPPRKQFKSYKEHIKTPNVHQSKDNIIKKRAASSVKNDDRKQSTRTAKSVSRIDEVVELALEELRKMPDLTRIKETLKRVTN